MKRFAVLFISFFIFSATMPFSALAAETLSDTSMSNISGQGDFLGFSEENDQTVHADYSVTIPGDYQPGADQSRFSFSGTHDGFHKTVLLDFIGKDVIDEFGNTFRENFQINAHISDIVYENKDNHSFVLFNGFVNGTISIPEYYGNDISKISKTVQLSLGNIPEGIAGTNFICSYQGNIFEPDQITDEETSFAIYPNRQAQTVGIAEGGDLAILIPVENDNGTFSWEVGTIIPEGKKYIHMDLNLMNERRLIQYDVKVSNNIEGLDNSDLTDSEFMPEYRTGTLGSIFVDSASSVQGGSVFITVD